jgi:hypothetical protein
MMVIKVLKYIFILFICFSCLFVDATFSQDKCGGIKDRDKKAYCQAVDTQKKTFATKSATTTSPKPVRPASKTTPEFAIP